MIGHHVLIGLKAWVRHETSLALRVLYFDFTLFTYTLSST